MPSFYDFPVWSIDGIPDLLAPLRGNVALVVNVASKCGYTPQYAGLERLYREMKEQGFTIIGFPCNQFGAQEPAPDSDIIQFCTTTYDVTFPMSAKVEVNGPGRHPIYAWLTAAANGFAGDIQWNFEKFLIARDGTVVARYPSGTKPQDNGLLQDIAAQI
ncbi:MAG TPA: glutathione peroxidase [Povalibacter sp.]|nr:glutathione peroxidase [Povalibacter sp.]